MNITQLAADIDYIKRALTSNKRVLNITEAAEYLGFSQSYVYKLTSGGVLPFSKPNGKTIFFDREKLDQWLLSNSSSDTETEAANYINTEKI